MTARRAILDPTDPADIGAVQRMRETTAILAAGVVRLRERHPVSQHQVRSCLNYGPDAALVALTTPRIPPDSREIGLEVSHRSRPDDQRG